MPDTMDLREKTKGGRREKKKATMRNKTLGKKRTKQPLQSNGPPKLLEHRSVGHFGLVAPHDSRPRGQLVRVVVSVFFFQRFYPGDCRDLSIERKVV
jgi:hypothetical protein